MSDSRTHPHVEMPGKDELERLIESKQPALRQVYLDAHRLVLDAVPGVRFEVDCADAQIGYGARQFGYDGWGMAAITPYTGWVSLAFLHGTRLDDPATLLEGTGALVRHVKVRTPDDLAEKRDALRRLLVSAASVHGE